MLSADKLDAVRFRLKARFAPEAAELPPWEKGPSIIWPDFQLGIAILEHHGVSLGFAVQEPIHVNIWRNRLDARGLRPGPWLQHLKRAIYADECGNVLIDLPDGQTATLGELRDLATVERGQKIACVTDIADTQANRTAVCAIAREADLFFVEASFSAADRAQATARAHLTTTAAGEIARAAAVRRVEPFHFSPRYAGEEARMLDEVSAAFRSDR